MIKAKRCAITSQSRGDNAWFFILYSLFSALFFFLLGTIFSIFDNISAVADVFTMNFMISLIQVFFVNLTSSLIAWFLTFFTLKYLKKYVFHTVFKSYGDLSKGLNKFPLVSLSSIISMMLSSLLLAIGFFSILQSALFGENTFVSLVITYLLVKITVHIITIIIVESKF